MGAMVRTLVSVLLVLGGCGGSAKQEKPAVEKAVGKAEAKAGVEAKTVADAKQVVEGKAGAGAGAKAVEPGPEPVAAVEPGVVAKPELEPFEGEDGQFGYRTAAGEVVIPAKYPMAMPFVDGVAGVVGGDGWVFIDRTGKTLATAFMFDNAADDFVEGRARIVDGEKYGFIASTGEIVVPPTYAFVEAFSGGYAAVCEGCKREEMGEHFSMTGGKWGYVDAAGKLVIPPRFETAGPFADGRATVTEAGRELVIGPDGVEKK